MHYLKSILFFNLFFLTITTLFSQISYGNLYRDAGQTAWVDAQYEKMDLAEKIGQLIMYPAYSNRDEAHIEEIKQLIINQHIGGLIFMQDNPQKQIELTNLYQSISQTPLLIGIDGEWGLDMRLKNTYRFPWNMALGAVQNDDLIREMARQIGLQCREMGIHINFAPVVDLNTNPDNPIIGNRSFGSDFYNVSKKGEAFFQGLQAVHVIASAKHFPGHGDTSVDSHLGLPILNHSLERMQNIELQPFKKLSMQGIGSVMVGHLQVPALEPNTKLPATVSEKIITEILKKQLNYKGLIITDALNMKGIADHFPSGELEVLAFKAGNDILLFSQNVAKAKAQLIAAYQRGEITEERLAHSVKKILAAKYFVGLDQFKPLSVDNLNDRLIKPENQALHHQLMEEAITVLENKEQKLPFFNLKNKKWAYVPLEEGEGSLFFEYLNKYINFQQVNIKTAQDIAQLKNYDEIIIGVHKSNQHPWKSYKISPESLALIHTIGQQFKKNTHVVVFASPYSILSLDNQNINSLIIAYQNSEEAQKIVPQILFGAIEAKGKLPVDLKKYKEGNGLKTNTLKRLAYAKPEQVQMSTKKLNEIDDIAQKAINQNITPGMQILVARKGKVIYQKAFGNTAVTSNQQVSNNHLYDLASITKIAATLPMMLKLYDEQKVNLELPISTYLTAAWNTNKQEISFKEILTHQAGLEPWIRFDNLILDSLNNYNSVFYSNYYKKPFTHKVTENMFVNYTIRDSIYKRIYDSKLGSKKYKYSDLGYYLMMDFIENQRKKRLDEIVTEEFYKTMGAYTLRYNPLNLFDRQLLIPTEAEEHFRKKLIWGYVHDPGAALMGGIAGHAGLFSNSNDLAKVMQMYLQKGYYGGIQFIKPETINMAIQTQYPENGNHRGIGFDKKPFNGIGQTCKSATRNVFGHSGFVGNITWVDPDKELVYIFLSNRVNSNPKENKLSKQNIRENIFQIIYDAIQD